MRERIEIDAIPEIDSYGIRINWLRASNSSWCSPAIRLDIDMASPIVRKAINLAPTSFVRASGVPLARGLTANPPSAGEAHSHGHGSSSGRTDFESTPKWAVQNSVGPYGVVHRTKVNGELRDQLYHQNHKTPITSSSSLSGYNCSHQDGDLVWT